ncbi:hypothetical protein [Streptomyces tsukubensis]|uniref:hypothetical protein n=1 Tax=Streptomyces tsukubensis TaxID=83656 RepID=UPI00344D2830
MTDHSDDPDRIADLWLTQSQQALMDQLHSVFDAETRLREILLHSHHETATERLSTVLDVEAGLHGILRSHQAPPVLLTDEASPHGTDTAEILRTLSPAQRMALRSNPGVKEASRALSRDLDGVRDLSRPAGSDPVLAHRFRRDLYLRLAQTLARDLSLGIASGLSRARKRAWDLARDHMLAVNLDLAAESARRVARDILRPGNGTTPESTNVHELSALVDTLRLGRDRAYGLHPAIAREIDLARARTGDLRKAHTLYLADGHDHIQAYSVVIGTRIAEVGRAIGRALGREPLVADNDSLHALLDDFTTTDLSSVELAGIDLGGVHWSEHTTLWPPNVDIEAMKARSEQAPHGTGIWIIRSGTATIRDLVEK